MKLSDGEKLILLMLSEVFEKLKVEGSIDPALVKNAISHDHPWALKWEYDRVSALSGKNNLRENQVVDILNMWTLIE
ncbi:hypothetical protein SAMN05216412_101378 [Nitrosospira multiformis]|uniref:Uncharacterized protein n=1 Tax=Nitrosospira multiformis TaxID=1231 RepID=A0A1H9YV30_9PROT|nr:hypothetical protein [Nitrosospira multiformis]SES72521.1 hypothetical protein SAMN05216412_101378 [Nitrosospira multiformis]